MPEINENDVDSPTGSIYLSMCPTLYLSLFITYMSVYSLSIYLSLNVFFVFLSLFVLVCDTLLPRFIQLIQYFLKSCFHINNSNPVQKCLCAEFLYMKFNAKLLIHMHDLYFQNIFNKHNFFWLKLKYDEQKKEPKLRGVIF